MMWWNQKMRWSTKKTKKREQLCRRERQRVTLEVTVAPLSLDCQGQQHCEIVETDHGWGQIPEVYAHVDEWHSDCQFRSHEERETS